MKAYAYILFFLTLVMVALRLVWCPHVPLTGGVGLYMALAHVVQGIVIGVWIILWVCDDLIIHGMPDHLLRRPFFLRPLTYFWLWFIPFLIEGLAFKFLRVP